MSRAKGLSFRLDGTDSQADSPGCEGARPAGVLITPSPRSTTSPAPRSTGRLRGVNEWERKACRRRRNEQTRLWHQLNEDEECAVPDWLQSRERPGVLLRAAATAGGELAYCIDGVLTGIAPRTPSMQDA